MEQKRHPYLSVGIDIGADFSLMAIALPTQEIIGKPYKILHSSNRSVEGAVERILSTGRAYELPVRVYMESTGIYHLPLYHRLKDAGLDVYVLNPLVTHANQNINIRNIHNDKLDARRIALLGLRPDLKTSIVPADEVAAVKALLREYHAMKKENIYVHLPFEKPTPADLSPVFTALFQSKWESLPGGAVSLSLAQRCSVCWG